MTYTASSTGPLRLDLRSAAPIRALRILEETLLRVAAGPRIVVLKVAGAATIDALLHWAEDLEIPLERVAGEAGGEELRLYLLPAAFGERPLDAAPTRRPERALESRAT